MDEETPSIPRYLGEGWRGSPRPSHNNEKQSMVFVKSSANDKSSPRLEDLSFADDLTNPIDCFSLLWDGRGDPLHPSPRKRGGWATGSRRDRRRPQETSAPVTRFEKKLPTAPLIAPKDKPQHAVVYHATVVGFLGALSWVPASVGAHVSTLCLLADARCGLSFGAIRGAVGSFFSKRVTGAEVSWGRLLSLRDPVAQPPRYLGEGWRGSPRPSHNNEKQSMGFVKSSANDKSSNLGESLNFADDLTNTIDCFSL